MGFPERSHGQSPGSKSKKRDHKAALPLEEFLSSAGSPLSEPPVFLEKCDFPLVSVQSSGSS